MQHGGSSWSLLIEATPAAAPVLPGPAPTIAKQPCHINPAPTPTVTPKQYAGSGVFLIEMMQFLEGIVIK